MKYKLRMKFFLLAFAGLGWGLFFSSCTNSKYSDYEKTATGLMYKFHKHGNDTVHPKYGEVVRITMIKRMDDSTLETTDVVSPDGVEQYLGEPTFKGAIEEGIRLMTIGDSVTFLINTDSINKYYPAKDSTKNFKPNSFLAIDMKLSNIRTMEDVRWEQEQKRKQFIAERKEKGPQELSQYIQDNHIDVKPTKNGMYFIETVKGKGSSPKDGDTAVVHYTGSFLNGTIFDSSVKRNEPFNFVVGAKQVIEGWEQAIKMMKKGTTATIILPYNLAYDSTGYMNRETGKYFIPPYAPMKFDIQLLDIKSRK